MQLLRDNQDRTKWSAAGVLPTKIEPPLLQTGMQARHRLMERFSKGRDLPLAVISGIAGSGKTTLVTQWITQDELCAAWYRLDQTDNNLEVFFRHLLASLSVADNQSAAVYDRWLGDRKGLDGAEISLRLVECLIDIQHDIHFVLDDYHMITSAEVHAFLGRFLDHMPPNSHVVLTTRYSLPFSLSRFRVRNQLVEISASDIHFTFPETMAFLAETLPSRLNPEEMASVARFTEGWIGSLQLFVQILNSNSKKESLGESLIQLSREIGDFLSRDVVDTQPPKVKEFLEATAPLERFNAEICSGITGIEGTDNLLDFVYRNNLFLVPLDAEETWYRYHYLFSEAMRQRLQASSPNVLPLVHRNAALWFVRNGYLEDAFQNAFATEDFEFAIDLIEDYLLFIHHRFEYASGLRWLARLPDEKVMHRTVLRLHECGQRMESFQFDDIEAAIEDIENSPGHHFRKLKGFKKRLGLDLLTYFRYALRYFYRDPLHADVNRLNEGFGKISSENRVFLGYIKILIAISYLLRGSPLLAETALQEAWPLVFASGNPWARTHWFRLTAVVERMKGHLRRSETVLQEAFTFLEQRGLSKAPLSFVLYPPMAWVFYQRNDLEKAREYATGAALHGEHVKFAQDVMEGNLLLSLISIAEGKHQDSRDYLQRMLRVSKEFDTTDGNRWFRDPWAVRLSLMEGEIDKGVLWAEERRLSLDEPFSVRFSLECIAQAELLYHRGLYHDALLVLDQLRGMCLERHVMETVLEIDLLRSGAIWAMGDRAHATSVMEEAVSFACKEGYVRLFANYSSVVSPVLKEIKGNPPAIGLLRRLAPTPPASSIEVLTRKPGWERGKADLTHREIELLKLMAEGLQYKEIATRTYLSLETVKTHAKNIFRKLEVNTRLQAIRRAEALGFRTERL
jgi:LuxR family maltose regulon positive regulatory protein